MRAKTKAAIGLGVIGLAAWTWSRRRHWPGFRGRVVLITGGSRGLGLVLARAFGRRGAKVAICARDAKELDWAKRDLERRGVEVFARTCDVTDANRVKELVAAVEDRFGGIDVLVNNAGVIQVGPLDTTTLEDFESAMKVHYWAPLYAIQAVLPGMRRRGDGRIVNIASIGGKIAMPHLLPYDGSKFALVGLSEGLRAELAGEGVYVTTVVPGLMRTGSPVKALFKGRYQLEYAWFALSDSLPLVSMDVERAARRIVEAARQGRSEVVLSIPAKLASKLHQLFPNFTTGVLGLVNRMLPRSGGIGAMSRTGRESESRFTQRMVPAYARRAAVENNQS